MKGIWFAMGNSIIVSKHLQCLFKDNESRKIWYWYFHSTALRKLGMLCLFLWDLSEQPEAQLIRTLSNFHCLLHEVYPTNHRSSQEHAIYGTSCLLLAFLNLTTCHPSNLRSINLIWSPSPLSLSLSSFFLCWSSAWATMVFPQHDSLWKGRISSS